VGETAYRRARQNHPGVGEVKADAAPDKERRKRDDEGCDPQLDHKEGIYSAKSYPDGDRNQEAKPGGRRREIESERNGHNIHRSTDREVNAGYEQHERHPHSHYGKVRRLKQNVCEILQAEEATRHDAEHSDDDRKKDSRKQPKESGKSSGGRW